MSFSIDVSRWVKRTGKAIEENKRAIVFELGSQIIKKTPVDTGRAKGNWQYGFNRVPTGTVKKTDSSPLGSSGQGTQLLTKISTEPGLDYIVNNLDYINKLEDGGSKQAPAGMVKTTVVAFKRIAARFGFDL